MKWHDGPPPHDVVAEDAVIGALLVSGYLVEGLTPGDFYSGRNGLVFRTALDLAERSTKIDSITVGTLMRDRGQLDGIGGLASLNDLVRDAPTVSEEKLVEYGKTIAEKARLRRVLRICQEAVAKLYGPLEDPGAFVDGLEQKLFDLSWTDGVRVETAPVVVQESFARVDEAFRSGRGRVGISTGLRALDDILGGLFPGEQVIIAGRPGISKTSLALHICMAVCRVGSAIMFSAEMPKSQIGDRMLCIQSGVNLADLRSADLTLEDMTRLQNASNEIANLYGNLHIDETSSLTPMDIRAKIRRLSTQAKRIGAPLHLAVVDYLQLLRYPGAQNRENEVAAISRSLKSIAKEFGITMVSVSQLNRQVEHREDRRPGLADLRESGSLEQDADVVIMLYRDSYYSKDQNDDSCELIAVKQRNGPTGSVNVKFLAPSTRFTDV